MDKSCPIFLFYLLILIQCRRTLAERTQGRNQCYSCASENMKENFLTRSRGPTGRIREPRIYDSMCDLDSWLIREKAAVECQGPCFKWQQVLNNSGVFSYATIRDCFERMFDASVPTPSTAGGTGYTTDCKHVQIPLTCLDQSSVEEHTCFCMGEFCNSAPNAKWNSFWLAILLFIFTTFL